MRRFFLLGLLTGFLSGCGSSTPPAESNPPAPKSASRAAPAQAAPAQAAPRGTVAAGELASKTPTGDSRDDAAAASLESAKQLDQIVAKANEAQSRFAFGEAASYWQQAMNLLNQRYGAKAWQTLNARLALENAELQSRFDESQLVRLKDLFNDQAEIASLLKQARQPAALELAKKSQQTTSDLFGAESWMMAKQWVQLARLQQLSGNPKAAIAAYRETILLHDRFLQELHPDKETLHAYLGEAFLQVGQIQPAIDNLSKSALIAQKLWGEASLQYGTRANDLGVAYQRAGQNETALTVLRAAEAIRRKELGPNDPMVAHSLLNLGTVYMELNRSEFAVQSFEQAIPILEEKFGVESKMVIEAKLRQAAAIVLSGQAEAAELLLEKLTAQLKDRPGLSAERSVAQYRLAVLQARQGNYTAAEPNFEAAIAAQSQLFGPDHPTTELSKRALAQVFRQTGRAEQAAALQSQIRQVNYAEAETQFKR